MPRAEGVVAGHLEPAEDLRLIPGCHRETCDHDPAVRRSPHDKKRRGATTSNIAVASMSNRPFLEDLPLLTPQQRREVRAAFQVALVESPLPTVLTDLEGRILGTNSLVEEL